jgi:Tol biopolymer transport system component
MKRTPVVALILLLAVAALAQPEQLTSGGGAHPTVSPDGAWVAFNFNNGIWRVPSEGGERQIVSGFGYDADWSPTQDVIVYRYEQSLRTAEVFSGNGGGLVSGGDFPEPAWAPDGNSVVCGGDESVIMVAFPSGNTSTPDCTGSCDGEDPDWSPDGASICFEDGLQIVTMPATGGASTVLVDCGDDVAYPAWSPDGRYIAFSRETNPGSMSIWVADVVTAELFRVTGDGFVDREAAWGPDGEWIYFSSDRSGSGEIWRVPFSEETPAQRMSWGGVKRIFH